MKPEVPKKIFYRHFDLPASFPAIGLLGDSWQGIHEPLTRLHFHNCMEIGYLFEGRGTYYLEDQIVPFEAPCVMIAPPNVPHGHFVDEGHVCKWNWIYVDFLAMLPQMTPRLASRFSEFQRCARGAACVMPGEQYPEILSLVQLIIREMEQGRLYYQHVVRELLYSLSMLFLRSFSGTTKIDHCVSSQLGCISPAVTYIAENYMNEVSVDALAQMCHLSTSHFRRIFRQVLGCAPLDYLQLVRIDRACVLLYNCEYSVTEISMQVGYPSPSSFNRQFRRIHGVSPNQWRHIMRSEENPVVTAYFHSLPPATVQFFPVEYQPF